MKPPWDTLLAFRGRRSPLRSAFSWGKVSVDVHLQSGGGCAHRRESGAHTRRVL